jgi:hypothetical protein
MAMERHQSIEVLERVQALYGLITGNPAPDSELDSLVKHLTVGKQANSTFRRATLLKIQNKLKGMKEGPILLTHFNKQYDICQSKSYQFLVDPFMMFLQPLSCPSPSTTIFPNAIQSNQNLAKNVKKMDSNPSSLLTQTNSQKEEISNYNKKQSDSLNILQINKESTKELKQIDLDLMNSRAQKQDQMRANQNNQNMENKEKPNNNWISPELERKLIVDIIYILGGVNGSHIRLDLRSESFVIDPSLHLHPTTRDIVLCICELGWLYNKVSQYREQILGSVSGSGSGSSSGPSPKGLVVQAFAFALNVSDFLSFSLPRSLSFVLCFSYSSSFICWFL